MTFDCSLRRDGGFEIFFCEKAWFIVLVVPVNNVSWRKTNPQDQDKKLFGARVHSNSTDSKSSKYSVRRIRQRFCVGTKFHCTFFLVRILTIKIFWQGDVQHKDPFVWVQEVLCCILFFRCV